MPGFSKKHHVRAVFRTATLLCLVIGYGTYNLVSPSSKTNLLQEYHLSKTTSNQLENVVSANHRRLSEDNSDTNMNRQLSRAKSNKFKDILPENYRYSSIPEESTDTKRILEDDCKKLGPGLLTIHILGVLYLFLGIAIVCDEFFVPALEEMAGENHLNLSMDVAGATLMAAGGSAPELFTSMKGVFNESEIGFGTIVGSAVFNVLFVIAFCCLLSKDVLQLTWWPLLRDSAYYVMSLCILALFVGVITPGVIEWWEALVLFLLYFGYVILMKYNQALYKLLAGKEEESVDTNEDHASYTHCGTWGGGTFRSGIIALIRNPDQWLVSAGMGMVSQMVGDVDDAFKEIDKNGDGYVDKNELAALFQHLDCSLQEEATESAFAELDLDSDGKITQQEFASFYLHSEGQLRKRLLTVFQFFDTDKSNSIDSGELKNLLTRIEPSTSQSGIDEAMKALSVSDQDEITFDQFFNWFTKSDLFGKTCDFAADEMNGIFSSLKPPSRGTFFQYLSYIIYLPLLITLTFTIPDVRVSGFGRWCYFSFILSIAWIGVYSSLMVGWTQKIGATVGIPDFIMGLTFIAAGTSVPDLLSSVIVARRGEGDMAVSSSIGSNIFDILVGLPVPWLAYIVWPNAATKITIAAEGIEISLLILLGMVVAVILTIHCNKWKLTNLVGYAMLLLYLAFLVQAVALRWPFDESC